MLAFTSGVTKSLTSLRIILRHGSYKQLLLKHFCYICNSELDMEKDISVLNCMIVYITCVKKCVSIFKIYYYLFNKSLILQGMKRQLCQRMKLLLHTMKTTTLLVNIC